MKVAQLCPTLCNPMDYIVHGILQARILEWVASPLSRGSSQARDQTQVSRIAGGLFTSWATRQPLKVSRCLTSTRVAVWVRTIDDSGVGDTGFRNLMEMSSRGLPSGVRAGRSGAHGDTDGAVYL